MQFGFENHPSTYRGLTLVMAVVFAYFDRANALQYFMAGLGAAGMIGLTTKEGGK